jgi:O-antigen ligase
MVEAGAGAARMTGAKAGDADASASLWPWLRVLGRIVAYLGVPASTLQAITGVFNTINVLTAIYIVALIGLVAVLRGAKIRPDVLMLGAVLAVWYFVLFAFEVVHGGPFHDVYPWGGNFLTDYFPLLALPFFVTGLQEVKADYRIFERVIMATIVFSVAVALYQFLVQGVGRPNGLSRNPIPFALVMTTWGLFLLARGLRSPPKIEWLPVGVALLALIPVLLSGSKNVWFCAGVGYLALVLLWATARQRAYIVGALAVAAVPAAWLIWQVETIRLRLIENFTDLADYVSSGDTSGGSFGLRVGTIVSGFLAFLDRPLQGYGLAQGKAAAIEHLPAGFASISHLNHLHNEYITHLVAFGILGGVFIVMFFALFILGALRREPRDIRQFGVTAGALFLIYMAADVVFTLPEVYGLVFFVLGLVLMASPRAEYAMPSWFASSPSDASAGRWSLPKGAVAVLVVALLVGVVGLGWAQRGAYVRIAQASILHEQPMKQGEAIYDIPGSLRWRFYAADAGGPAIAADLDVPGTGARFLFTLRKNSDASLPASHIIEIRSFTPPDFPDKAVTSVNGLWAKGRPDERGIELIAGAADLGKGVFWLGLSPEPRDYRANMQLLAQASFFDLDMTYASGRHVVLTFEKGSAGAAVFEQGFRALVN